MSSSAAAPLATEAGVRRGPRLQRPGSQHVVYLPHLVLPQGHPAGQRPGRYSSPHWTDSGRTLHASHRVPVRHNTILVLWVREEETVAYNGDSSSCSVSVLLLAQVSPVQVPRHSAWLGDSVVRSVHCHLPVWVGLRANIPSLSHP